MPYRLFHSSPHDAETVQLMTQVFDEVCIELGLANREDRLRDLIAHEVLQCVSKGERDRSQLLACARKALNMPPPTA
jgi:hypothetical protein